MAKTILERAMDLAAATEKLHIAAHLLSAPLPAGGSDYQRVDRAVELARRAVQYTQALQAMARRGATRGT